uniref:DUF4789 domain-containing protein n=1 Tax=Caenorhabditis tropicalis TaxID=1561998 RepID=A0A1I7UZ53_9PELO
MAIEMIDISRISWSDEVPFPDDECNLVTEFEVTDGADFMDKFMIMASEKAKTDPEKASKLAEHTIFNCFNPKQTAIRCKEQPCMINGKPMQIPNCICGPESGLHKTDFIMGPAGSKCPGAVDDGLCVVSNIGYMKGKGEGEMIEGSEGSKEKRVVTMMPLESSPLEPFSFWPSSI